MIGEGLKLMVLGMGIVYLFLIVLVFVIKINARLLGGLTAREMQPSGDSYAEKRKQLRERKIKAQEEEKRRLVAVMAAATAAHRAKKR